MKSTLPATHLLRQILLFVFIVIFLLLLTRSAYMLWQFPAVEALGNPIPLFLTGLRFDLSVIGAACLPPLVIGSLLGMFNGTRVFAKWFVVVFLITALILILGAELLAPAFLAAGEGRPTAGAFADPVGLITNVSQLAASHPVLSTASAVVVGLVAMAYAARMETARFLRYRLSRPSALALAIIGGIACISLVRSQYDPRLPALSLADAQFGVEPVVNELATNSAWVLVSSLVEPLISALTPS